MKRFINYCLLAILLCSSLSALSKPTKKPDSYAYTRGVEALDADNYEEAEQWFLRELNDHPDNGYAYLYLSAINRAKDQYGSALNAAEMAIKKIPKKDKEWHAAGYLCRANLYAEMGDTLKALADLEQTLKIDPERTKALEDRGEIYFEQGKYDLSDADFRRLIEIKPGGVMGYMGVGRNALRQGNLDEAIAQFTQAIKMEPKYDLGYAFRAEAYIEKKMWNEATDDLVKALDISGNQKAFYLMKDDLPDEALSLMNVKLKIQMAKQPSSDYWPFSVGIMSQKKKDYKEAISYYEKAFSINGDPIVLDYLAKCAMEAEWYEKALDYVNRAMDLNPEDPDFLWLRARILEHLGRLVDADADLNKYIEMNPGAAIGYLYRAENCMDLLKFEEAIEDYNTVGALVPIFFESPYFLMKRGDAYRLSGKPAEADADYNKMIELEKDSVLSSNSWTPFAYSGLGQKEKALETMLYIVENDTTDTIGTQYNLACQYARLGMNEKAIESLKDAIRKGYKNMVHIQKDYDLEPIRNLPEFQSVVDEYYTIYPVEEVGDEPSEVIEGRMETVEVPFTKKGGVTEVRCNVNDLPLYFVFDTGAADVTLSMVEANFMLKNDYIKPSDVVGTARYIDANGDVSEGTVINLRKVNFGGLELDNVRASVVRNQKAPLLLGQSVLGRLGKIEIDNQNQKLKITHRVKN